MNIAIETNIVNYLFVTMFCPVCHEPIEISLGMIHRKEAGICPYCITPMVLSMKGEWLDTFVSQFDNLYEQLQEHDLPLILSDSPVATTLESE